VVAGIFTDTWFYGQPVLTSWNYFYINIAKGAASSFGIMDAKNYYQWFLLSSIYPIGILITLSLVITAFKYRGQLLIWAITPFIVMHFLIPHKELRFLFPIALLLPVLLVQAWQLVRVKNTWIRYALILPLIFLNIMGICINLSKDAGDGRIAITSYLSRQYDNRPYTVMYGPGANPYRPWDFLAEHFYLAPNIRELDIKKYDHQPVEALIIRHSDADKPYYKNIIRDLHMQRKMQGIPAWAIRLLSWYYADKHPDYLLLYTI
jgi:phosphatidylinositol glycan class B